MTTPDRSKISFTDPKFARHFEKTIGSNIAPFVLVIVRDTVDNCMRDFEDSKRLMRDWVTPLLILLTLVPVLATTNFKSIAFVNAEMLKGAVGLLLFLLVLWLLWAGIKAVKGGMTREQVLARLDKASMNKSV